MALDYLAFTRLVELIKEKIEGGKITRITQISNEEFLFIIRQNSENVNLLISTHPNMSYINLIQRKPESSHVTSNLTLLFKKHFENGKISEISQENNDRIIKMSVVNRDDYYNHTTKYLYIELIGRASNLILCDSQNIILDSLKKIPLAYTNLRTIQAGIHYVLPSHPEGEKLPYNLENELNYLHITLDELKVKIAKSNQIFITSKDKKRDFHFIPMTFMEGEIRSYLWSEGLEAYYGQILGAERHRQFTSELEHLAKNEVKKSEKKMEKLLIELETSKQSGIYKEYGDLLLTYGQDQKEKCKKICIENEFLPEKIEIELDDRYDVYQNANLYYKKYQKSKVAKIKIQEQIDLCKENIEYFKNILYQLSDADLLIASQIKEELVAQKYFRKYSNVDKTFNKKSKKQVTKVYKPLAFKVDDTVIYAGQNNLQNEYLTFKMANKNHMFFHVEQGHGAHVVVSSDHLNEKLIRSAAMIAAYYSSSRNSSSVPVSYTMIKNIKKIPGGKPGKVIITNQKTIYIDPNEQFISNLSHC